LKNNFNKKQKNELLFFCFLYFLRHKTNKTKIKKSIEITFFLLYNKIGDINENKA